MKRESKDIYTLAKRERERWRGREDERVRESELKTITTLATKEQHFFGKILDFFFVFKCYVILPDILPILIYSL